MINKKSLLDCVCIKIKHHAGQLIWIQKFICFMSNEQSNGKSMAQVMNKAIVIINYIVLLKQGYIGKGNHLKS